ncbi:hypothetical protein HK097_006624 [Rhizophlyctis rosea]|uniref:GH26 domain-containing protein n=1 Tax=Rhizophlyctis rosea TaxID=64517 RepID=A0AAD5SD41_9FUNG|nr:hypothetical protein HK097_006624 [Rhizophlyctis rosea]
MGKPLFAGASAVLLASSALAQLSDVVVYDGALAKGWDEWSWSLEGSTVYNYAGAPAAPNGKPVIKTSVTQWGALSLHSNNNDFYGAKTLVLLLAADSKPNFNIFLQDAANANSAAQSTSGNCEAWAAGAYAKCTFDLSGIPDGTWNRVNFQNTDAATNTLYLSDVKLSATEKPPYVVPDSYPTYPANEQWCQDLAPSADYTCEQQAGWGKCNLTENPWMNGYCQVTCNACPQYAPRSQPWKLSAPYDKKLNKAAKTLYDSLKFSFNRKVLSGQAETADTSQDRDGEFKFIANLTGATPAVRLMDFIFYVGEPAFEDGSIARAIDWYQNKSGIVQYQWHWRPRAEYGSSFYAAETTFDITKAVVKGTKEYNHTIEDIAGVIAKAKLLEKAGVPFIFRPLHEPNGGWFWWGSKGAAPYLKMWDLIQSEFTKAKVHNVIWLHNFAGAPVPEWYPGNNKVDIVSVDRYSAPGVYDAYPSDFYRLKYITGGTKIQVFGENGPVPDIKLMVETGALWGYFATWNGDFIYGQKQNSEKELIRQYQHDKVFNLEDIQALVEAGVCPPAPKPRDPKKKIKYLLGKRLKKITEYLKEVAKDLVKYLAGKF